MTEPVNKRRYPPDLSPVGKALFAIIDWIAEVTELYKYDQFKEGIEEIDPAAIRNDLRAFINVSTDRSSRQDLAKILVDWIEVAQKVVGGSFDDADTEALIGLGMRGDAQQMRMGVSCTLGQVNVQILIKAERYEEAIETIERLFASDGAGNPIYEKSLMAPLANSVLNPNILPNLSKQILLRAITLSNLMILKSERIRVVTMLKQQLDR